jgi:hypothetical protein
MNRPKVYGRIANFATLKKPSKTWAFSLLLFGQLASILNSRIVSIDQKKGRVPVP